MHLHRRHWFALGACIAGAAMAQFVGIIWLFPLVPTVILWGTGKWLISGRGRFLVPAVSLQVGLLVWYIAASAYTYQLAPADLAEGAVLIGLSAWLLARPSLMLVVLVATFQALMLCFNVFLFSHVEVGGVAQKALAVYIIWRVGSLLLLWEGYASLLRSAPGKPAAVAA
jgi:hypothetical protein